MAGTDAPIPGVVPGFSLHDERLLLDANPLIDVANAARRSGVVLRGRWLAENELRAGLEAVSKRSAALPRD